MVRIVGISLLTKVYKALLFQAQEKKSTQCYKLSKSKVKINHCIEEKVNKLKKIHELRNNTVLKSHSN